MAVQYGTGPQEWAAEQYRVTKAPALTNLNSS
jgi:hypothetical protein